MLFLKVKNMKKKVRGFWEKFSQGQKAIVFVHFAVRALARSSTVANLQAPAAFLAASLRAPLRAARPGEPLAQLARLLPRILVPLGDLNRSLAIRSALDQPLDDAGAR